MWADREREGDVGRQGGGCGQIGRGRVMWADREGDVDRQGEGG